MIEQIDIINIARNVLRKWFYIFAISTIVAFCVGILSIRSYQPTYKTQVLIAVYGKSSYGGVVYDAEETADVFCEVITSSLLQKKVAAEMGIGSLPGKLSCENVSYTNMITITATADTPQDALTTIYGVLQYHGVVTDKLLGDMVLQVLEEPSVPTAPMTAYNEKDTLVKAFGYSALLLTALSAVLVYFRDDIKNEAMVEQKLDTKLLAAICHEDIKNRFSLFRGGSRKQNKGLLITNPATSFGFTETFQKLCMRLTHKTKKKDLKSIVVTSLMENEGKSTICINLALSLAKMGKKVLLIDLDLRKPAVYKLLGLSYGKKDAQISDILAGKAAVKGCLRKTRDTGVYVLAGNRSCLDSNNLLNGEIVGMLIREMKKHVDYVIIDTPPVGAVSDAEAVMRCADAGILVVRQDGAVAKDINDTIDTFKNADCELLGCVLNDVVTGLFGGSKLEKDRYNRKYYHYGKYGQ